MQQDDVWRWRQRTWTEHIIMAFLTSLRDFASVKHFDHTDILIRAEQICGCFIDPRCGIPSIHTYSNGHRCWIDFVRREQLSDYPYTSEEVKEVRPDFIVAVRLEDNGSLLSVLCVWTVLDHGLFESRDEVHSKSLQTALKHPANGVTGLILRPLAPGETRTVMQKQASTILMAIPIQSQSSIKEITSLIETILEIERQTNA